MRRFLIVFILMCGLFLVGQTPNHNAVIITGDIPEGVKEKIEEALEEGDTLNTGIWGLQEAREEGVRHSYNEFWNDTYLMWELLWEEKG